MKTAKRNAPNAMNVEVIERSVTVANPQGLHMRPAAEFAKTAGRFQSEIVVRRDDRRVNGKSLMDLLLLAAEPGSRLVLEVRGDDAQAALAALEGVLEVCDWDAVAETAEPHTG